MKTKKQREIMFLQSANPEMVQFIVQGLKDNEKINPNKTHINDMPIHYVLLGEGVNPICGETIGIFADGTKSSRFLPQRHKVTCPTCLGILNRKYTNNLPFDSRGRVRSRFF